MKFKDIIREFFCNSEGIFTPHYYYAFVFLHLTILLIIITIVFLIIDAINTREFKPPTELILGMMVYVIALIGLYSYVKHRKRIDK